MKSPKDQSLSAREQYRSVIARDFDLVLIENNCPLEPNYVIVEDLPESITADDIKRLNESAIPQNINVEVTKHKLHGQDYSKLCHIVFDFKADSRSA